MALPSFVIIFLTKIEIDWNFYNFKYKLQIIILSGVDWNLSIFFQILYVKVVWLRSILLKKSRY